MNTLLFENAEKEISEANPHDAQVVRQWFEGIKIETDNLLKRSIRISLGYYGDLADIRGKPDLITNVTNHNVDDHIPLLGVVQALKDLELGARYNLELATNVFMKHSPFWSGPMKASTDNTAMEKIAEMKLIVQKIGETRLDTAMLFSNIEKSIK